VDGAELVGGSAGPGSGRRKLTPVACPVADQAGGASVSRQFFAATRLAVDPWLTVALRVRGQ
jgi:hypothetical protein